MKKLSIAMLIGLYMGFMNPLSIFAQHIYWAKQTITSNSGKFEFSPPYEDYVNLQSFNILTQNLNQIGTIFTQSSQDICIKNGIAYVAAQDSIIKYDLNTYTRMAAIADSGLNKLFLFGGKLLVSKQYPVSTGFLEVLDTADLSLIARVDGISGDCGGITMLDDTVYLAVNGGWMGTEGKLAIIETIGWNLVREVNLGPDAIGIMQVYAVPGRIITVNKSPYSTPDKGSITTYYTGNQSFTNTILNVNIGNGTGIMNNLLYLGLNYGIGTIDLSTMLIADTNIVADPGSAFYVYVTSAALDTINDRLYTNIGDYFSNGYCLITNLNGDSISSYPTGISTDVVALDYRESPAGLPGNENEPYRLSVYPNPASENLTIKYDNENEINEVTITDMLGKKVFCNDKISGNSATISIFHLKPGIYCITVKTKEHSTMTKFIRQ